MGYLFFSIGLSPYEIGDARVFQQQPAVLEQWPTKCKMLTTGRVGQVPFKQWQGYPWMIWNKHDNLPTFQETLTNVAFIVHIGPY